MVHICGDSKTFQGALLANVEHCKYEAEYLPVFVFIGLGCIPASMRKLLLLKYTEGRRPANIEPPCSTTDQAAAEGPEETVHRLGNHSSLVA
ncbi:hypothetical protein NDU88_000845 [Pleurodeles waltl]|uniref:Uncharacterized protein n=1 Tax=Pleurodeles waltl TaxID=8319 RepID=A0AAV7Q1Y7_PLEWA|nr:hypothetical protein NDU88_000845 [Pleurodeles waltl]